MQYRRRTESTTTISLLKFILWRLVCVIFFTTIFQISNRFVDLWLTKFGVSIPKDTDYVTLLATVIGVGGVFIGLYYAAITTVCSAIYAEAPNNIRDLLAQDRVGNFYIRFIALLTTFGVCLLTLQVIRIQPAILSMLAFLLGAGLMIIGFVRLGTRAFHLFDPTILSGTIFKQLRQCYKKVQAGGYHWSYQYLQSQSHQNAQKTIDTLSTLSSIAAKQPHLNGSPFADMCKNMILFLCNYETKRKLIPTESLWYRERYEHPDWYRTGDTEVSIAHETAAGLQPTVVRDTRWIESEILPIVERCLKINLDEKRYEIVNLLLGSLDEYVQILAAEHQVEYAVNHIDNIFAWCEKLLFVDEGNVVSEEPLEHMEICERLAIMPINVLVAYIRTIGLYYEQDTDLRRIGNISWKSEKSIYKAGFAEHVLKVLEELRPRLMLEERIEGRIISEPWYIQKLIAQKEAENIGNALVCFYEQVSELYARWLGNARSSQHPWLAAQIISRESEYWNKLDLHTPTLYRLWNDLNMDNE